MYLIKKLKQVPRKVWLIFILVLTMLLIVLVTILAANVLGGGGGGPVVSTHCGKVRGRRNMSADGQEISEFLYIPYSGARVGERRWKHSSLIGGGDCWSGVYPADRDREIKCVQAYYTDPQVGQEDCLHLSVRTPNISSSGLPVLVWIHGGSLSYGYAEEVGYSADTDFTAAVKSVTVNINYRLDLLGFTSHPALWEDGESYGNFGINDALTALQWVQTNIAAFGGDPRQVTIMGESSGGTIVLALVTAPKAQGLFQRAVSMSSAPLWKSSYEDAHMRRPDFLKHVNCDGLSSNAEVASCLKSADLELLINAGTTANRGWGFYDFPLSDGELGESMDYNVKEPFLLPYLPQDIPDQKDRSGEVELILSNTAQENGFWWIFYDNNRVLNWTAAEELLRSRLDKFLGDKKQNLETLLSEIKIRYNFGVNTEGWSPQKFWDTLTTDIRATCPMNELAERLNTSPHLRVHRLYIEHRVSSAMDKGAGWGAWHGWDTEAMFGFKYYRGKHYNVTAKHDWELRDQLIALTKQILKGETKRWSPNDTIYLMNETPWRESRTARPQSDLCEFWRDSGLSGWGWQN